MSLPRAYLTTKLTKRLPTTDGGVLATIGDAIAYMTAIPKQREVRQTWLAMPLPLISATQTVMILGPTRSNSISDTWRATSSIRS
jgi:hypothetical protein